MNLAKLRSKSLTKLTVSVAVALLASPVMAAQKSYTPKVVNYTTTAPAPIDKSYGYIDTARVGPQIIMAGATPSVIDVNDTSFEILALVRPGKNPLQSVTVGQSENPIFIKNLKHINTLKNGDQFWSVAFEFDKGAFGNKSIPIKWGNGNNQMFIRATDSSPKNLDGYQFPLISTGNNQSQVITVDTTKDDNLSYLKTKRAVPQIVMAGTSPAIVDLLDSSFDIVTLVRPGAVPLKSVLVKQGDNQTFSVAMEKKKELSNGDQIWVSNFAFPQGTFGTSTIPVVWGTGPGEFSIQVIDIADQVSTAYPLLRSGTFSAQ